MAAWTIELVVEPSVLVANSHLFDHPVTLAGAADFLDRPGHLILLARQPGGAGIGFVSGVDMRHPDKPPEMFVYELGVDEGWRRRGVASALLVALRDEAVRRGCRGMWTGADADNGAALATYEAMGAEIDRESVFITWDDVTAVQRASTGGRPTGAGAADVRPGETGD